MMMLLVRWVDLLMTGEDVLVRTGGDQLPGDKLQCCDSCWAEADMRLHQSTGCHGSSAGHSSECWWQRVVSSRGLHTRGLMDMRSSLCSVILRCIISDISQHHSSSPSDTEYCQQINIVTANITHFSHSCLLRPGGGNIYSGILMVDENFTLNC